MSNADKAVRAISFIDDLGEMLALVVMIPALALAAMGYLGALLNPIDPEWGTRCLLATIPVWLLSIMFRKMRRDTTGTTRWVLNLTSIALFGLGALWLFQGRFGHDPDPLRQAELLLQQQEKREFVEEQAQIKREHPDWEDIAVGLEQDRRELLRLGAQGRCAPYYCRYNGCPGSDSQGPNFRFERNRRWFCCEPNAGYPQLVRDNSRSTSPSYSIDGKIELKQYVCSKNAKPRPPLPRSKCHNTVRDFKALWGSQCSDSYSEAEVPGL